MVLPFEHIEFSRKTLGRKYFSFQNILTNKTENLFICHKPNTINQSQDRENLEKRKIFSWLNNFLLAVRTDRRGNSLLRWGGLQSHGKYEGSDRDKNTAPTFWLQLTLLSGNWNTVWPLYWSVKIFGFAAPVEYLQPEPQAWWLFPFGRDLFNILETFPVVGTEQSNDIIGPKGRTFIFLCSNCLILTIIRVDQSSTQQLHCSHQPWACLQYVALCMRHQPYLPLDHTLNTLLNWSNSNLVKILHWSLLSCIISPFTGLSYLNTQNKISILTLSIYQSFLIKSKVALNFLFLFHKVQLLSALKEWLCWLLLIWNY